VNTVTTTPVFATNPTGLNALRFRQVSRWLLVGPSFLHQSRQQEKKGKKTVRGSGRTGGGSVGPVKELEKILLGKARKWQERNQGTISLDPPLSEGFKTTPEQSDQPARTEPARKLLERTPLLSPTEYLAYSPWVVACAIHRVRDR